MRINTQTTLSISEARKKIFQIVDDVQKTGRYYLLTEKGKLKAAILSADEFESWVETAQVANEFPGLKDDLAQVREDISSGRYKNYTTFEKILEEEGFIVADRGREKYGLSNQAQAKRRKRTR